MRTFSILIVTLCMTMSTLSFSCSKKDNHSRDYFYQLDLSKKAIEASPVFQLEKETFERLCNGVTSSNTWFDICLETDEIAQYLLSQGFTALDFLAAGPNKDKYQHGTTILKFKRCRAGAQGEYPAFIFVIISKEVPVFNVTYNKDKTAIKNFKRGADQPRQSYIHALGRIVAAETE